MTKLGPTCQIPMIPITYSVSLHAVGMIIIIIHMSILFECRKWPWQEEGVDYIGCQKP